jgi:hypothetical protein
MDISDRDADHKLG